MWNKNFEVRQEIPIKQLAEKIEKQDIKLQNKLICYFNDVCEERFKTWKKTRENKDDDIKIEENMVFLEDEIILEKNEEEIVIEKKNEEGIVIEEIVIEEIDLLNSW